MDELNSILGAEAPSRSSVESAKFEDLLERHPGLDVSATANTAIFRGVVNVKQRWFRLSVKCPHYPQLTDMQLHVLHGNQVRTFADTDAMIKREWTVAELIDNLPFFLDEVEDSADHVFKISPTDSQYLSVAEQNIYAEITDLYTPEAYKIHLNSTCTRIRFSKFLHFEPHYLEVDLPSLHLVSHSLPDCSPWQQILQKHNSLSALLQQFTVYLEELRPFYEHFCDIDELCHVVQPIPPTTKHNWRLFVLRERVFIKLIIADPFAPISSMSVHIIGPTTDVESLRRTFSEGLRDWDADLDIHKNLLRIFDLCFFPMPLLGEAADNQPQFCNICYCYQLERGEIPIVSCDNEHCSLIFHAACLKEWFSSLSDGKTFLNVSFGVCPFCKAKLSTSFSELLETE